MILYQFYSLFHFFPKWKGRNYFFHYGKNLLSIFICVSLREGICTPTIYNLDLGCFSLDNTTGSGFGENISNICILAALLTTTFLTFSTFVSCQWSHDEESVPKQSFVTVHLRARLKSIKSQQHPETVTT